MSTTAQYYDRNGNPAERPSFCGCGAPPFIAGCSVHDPQYSPPTAPKVPRTLPNGGLEGGAWHRNNPADASDPSPGPSGGYTWTEHSRVAHGWRITRNEYGIAHLRDADTGCELDVCDDSIRVGQREFEQHIPLSGLAALLADSDADPESLFDMVEFIAQLNHARASLPDWRE